MTGNPENSVTGHDAGWRLKLVVVVSGAVLMGLELTGSRVIAAHFGSSIYVWGSIIGVFLVSLAAGYYLGGNLADRRPDFFLLNLLLLVAGVWLLTIPIYANWLSRIIRQANLGVRSGPLVATLLLFGGPSILMGMVSPFAVRLAARTVETMGNLSGRLYALSAFGSIVGTMVTAFWLIPSMGVRRLLQVLGLSLLVLPFLVFSKSRRLEDPGVVVDLVEIDPVVVEVSRKYFYLQPDARLRVHTEDGRSFVRRALETGERYDLVVLDAYTLGAQIPFHMTSREFMEEVKGVLAPDGVLLANIVNALEGTGSRVVRSEYKTLATVFSQLFMFPIRRSDERDQNKAFDPTRRRNIILIATNSSGEWSRDLVVAAASNIQQAGGGLKRTLVAFAHQFIQEPPRTDDVLVLTDDYAPVDTMVF